MSVPYELTPQQVQSRVHIIYQVIGNPMHDTFIRKIVTCDKIWVYYSNPDSSKQWLGPREPTKAIVKKIGSAPK